MWWKGVMGKSSGGKQVRAIMYGKMRIRGGDAVYLNTKKILKNLLIKKVL